MRRKKVNGPTFNWQPLLISKIPQLNRNFQDQDQYENDRMITGYVIKDLKIGGWFWSIGCQKVNSWSKVNLGKNAYFLLDKQIWTITSRTNDLCQCHESSQVNINQTTGHAQDLWLSNSGFNPYDVQSHKLQSDSDFINHKPRIHDAY